MSSATIKLFLIHGDARKLRTAEISNWNGKALAAPRTELEDLLSRNETKKAGIYFLIGTDPESGKPHSYIGEAEELSNRLKAHKERDFWVTVIAFISKDENLTKAHIRYLEGRLIKEARAAGRYTLENDKDSGAKLPESDREDMEVFLEKIQQLLPVLGTDILVPILSPTKETNLEGKLTCKVKDAMATGALIETGFLVYKNSTAILADRPSAELRHPYVVSLRRRLIEDGDLEEQNGFLVFTRNVEFTSPSAAASVIAGGGMNGLTSWKYNDGKSIKEKEGDG